MTLLVGLFGLVVAKADGTVSKEQREVVEFNRVEVAKGANVTLIQADRYDIEVVTQGCPTTDVDTRVENSTLMVKMKKKTKGSAVQVFVYFKDIEAVKVKTGASVRTEDGGSFDRKGKFTMEIDAKCEAEMELYVDELEVNATSCQITLSGRANKQVVDIRGTFKDSKYDAESLRSEDVEIYASGCGAIVNASKTLIAEAVGSDIRYVGQPDVQQKVSSRGTVQKAE